LRLAYLTMSNTFAALRLEEGELPRRTFARVRPEIRARRLLVDTPGRPAEISATYGV
jgi:hypothetical protein